ncbi:ankyrin repeat domain-containing protein [Candidatus Dependentiae bacterium]|nr:ankyrin repeat domain-containing protein [Candidatus Dependentiae bacterium]
MKKKFILVMFLANFNFKIFTMESKPEVLSDPEQFSYLMRLPEGPQLEIILKTIEGSAHKDLKLEQNIRLLFRIVSYFAQTNKQLKNLIENNKFLILKKIAYELEKIYSVDELDKAWPIYLNNIDTAAVLWLTGAKNFFTVFENVVDPRLGLEKSIRNLINRKDDLIKTLKELKTKFGFREEFKDLQTPKEDKVLNIMAKELKSKFNLKDLQLIWREFLNWTYVLKLLFQAGVNLNENISGETPLILASRQLFVSTIKFFVDELKANVNQQDFLGHSPLIYVIIAMIQEPDPIIPGAFIYKHADPDEKKKAVEILLNAKANVNLRSKNGKTALDYARELDLKEIEKILLAYGAKSGFESMTPLMLSSRIGDIKKMQQLIDSKVDLNAQDDLGRTALMIAVDSDRMTKDEKYQVVLTLLNAGANVNIKDKNRRTVFEYAKNQNLEDIYQLMFKAGVMGSGYIKTS